MKPLFAVSHRSRLAVAVAFVIALSANPAVILAAEEPSPEALTPEALKSELERVRKEAEALRNSAEAPAEWKESLAIQTKLAAMEESRTAALEPLNKRLAEIYVSPGFRKWHERVDALNDRLYSLRMAQYAEFRREGRELYEARHRELSRLAIASTPRARQLGFDVLGYPRMDGSTSTQPLAVLTACHCLGAAYEWVGREQLSARNMSSGQPFSFWSKPAEPELLLVEFTVQAGVQAPATERLSTIVNGLLAPNRDTHQAYVNLVEGKSDIALVARPPSAGEKDLARQKKVELDISACALDALVFLVNRDNPVRNLTTGQIRDIYSGKTTNWQEVGAAAGPITPFQREADSGSQELMRQLVMKELAFVKGRGGYPDRLILYGMGGPYVRLTTEKLGLAFSIYYYEKYMAGSPRTRTIAVDGIEPTYQTIRDRKYPFTSEVLVVNRKGLKPSDPAARLRQWLLSPEGQSVVRESGYVPISEQGL